MREWNSKLKGLKQKLLIVQAWLAELCSAICVETLFFLFFFHKENSHLRGRIHRALPEGLLAEGELGFFCVYFHCLPLGGISPRVYGRADPPLPPHSPEGDPTPRGCLREGLNITERPRAEGAAGWSPWGSPGVGWGSSWRNGGSWGGWRPGEGALWRWKGGGSGVPGGPAASPPSLGGVSERVWEGRRGWKPGRGGQQAICMRDRLGMSWSGRLSAHTERGRRRTRRRRRGGRRELPPPPPPGRGGEVRAKFGAAGPGCWKQLRAGRRGAGTNRAGLPGPGFVLPAAQRGLLGVERRGAEQGGGGALPGEPACPPSCRSPLPSSSGSWAGRKGSRTGRRRNGARRRWRAWWRSWRRRGSWTSWRRRSPRRTSTPSASPSPGKKMRGAERGDGHPGSQGIPPPRPERGSRGPAAPPPRRRLGAASSPRAL